MVWLKNGVAWLGHWMPKNNLPLIHPSDKVRFEHKGRRGGCMSEGEIEKEEGEEKRCPGAHLEKSSGCPTLGSGLGMKSRSVNLC